MATITVTKILDYAKLHRNSKDENVYNYLKNLIGRFELPPERYEQVIKELTEILGL